MDSNLKEEIAFASSREDGHQSNLPELKRLWHSQNPVLS